MTGEDVAREKTWLESERAETRDAVRSRTHEQQPLCQEVASEDKVVAVRHRLNKFIPGKNKVGEHKDNCAQCVEDTALKCTAKKHCRDENCIHAHAYSHNTCRHQRDNCCKYYEKKYCDTEENHRQITFSPESQLFIALNLRQVSLCKECDIEDVSYTE